MGIRDLPRYTARGRLRRRWAGPETSPVRETSPVAEQTSRIRASMRSAQVSKRQAGRRSRRRRRAAGSAGRGVGGQWRANASGEPPAPTSDRATRIPSTSSVTTSAMPPARDATTGVPTTSASRGDVGKALVAAGQHERIRPADPLHHLVVAEPAREAGTRPAHPEGGHQRLEAGVLRSFADDLEPGHGDEGHGLDQQVALLDRHQPPHEDEGAAPSPGGPTGRPRRHGPRWGSPSRRRGPTSRDRGLGEVTAGGHHPGGVSGRPGADPAHGRRAAPAAGAAGRRRSRRRSCRGVSLAPMPDRRRLEDWPQFGAARRPPSTARDGRARVA